MLFEQHQPERDASVPLADEPLRRGLSDQRKVRSGDTIAVRSALPDGPELMANPLSYTDRLAHRCWPYHGPRASTAPEICRPMEVNL